MPARLAYPACQRHGPKQPGSKPAVGWSGHEDHRSKLSFPSGEAARKGQHQRQSCLLLSASDTRVYVRTCALCSGAQGNRQPTSPNFPSVPIEQLPPLLYPTKAGCEQLFDIQKLSLTARKGSKRCH